MRRLTIVAVLCCCAFRLFGGSWTELGPKFPGRVSAIVATDVNHLWVATPGGGVWKSSDGGTNFTWAGNYEQTNFYH